jgi:peptidoglycan/LPS O-acetylase OafA/YrhL
MAAVAEMPAIASGSELPSLNPGLRSQIVRPHMPELDTLRGLAVLLVLLFHGFGFRYGLTGLTGIPRLLVASTLPGWAGVNLFFILSGFLITGILVDTRYRSDYFRSFYTRRALRILPLYYAVLVLLLALSRSGLILRPVSWPFIGLSAIFLSNVTELLGVPMQMGVLWSLAVEEHFYLIWPCAARRLSRLGLAALAAAVCIACPLLRLYYHLHGYYAPTSYTWLCADGLAMGALLGLLVRAEWCTRHRLTQISAAATTVSLVLLALRLASAGTQVFTAVFRETAVDLFFFGIVSSALLIGTSPWRAVVNRRFLQFLGRISYGVYLIHMLIFDLVDHAWARWVPAFHPRGNFGLMLLRFGIAAVLTLLAATLSRRYFEEPFLRMKTPPRSDHREVAVSGLRMGSAPSPQASTRFA